MTNRHGFSEIRHGYFTNPSICPLISGMMPIACPEKAAFGTVWTGDSSENGLQYAWVRSPSGWRESAGGRDTGQDGRTMNRTTTQWRIIYDNAL
jgi:hypothetical protein